MCHVVVDGVAVEVAHRRNHPLLVIFIIELRRVVVAVGHHHAIDYPPCLGHTGRRTVKPDLEKVSVHGGPTHIVEVHDTVFVPGTPDVPEVGVRPDDLRDQNRVVGEVLPVGPFVRFT